MKILNFKKIDAFTKDAASGNPAFCYYLLQQKMWSGDFSIEQGPSVDNPNNVMVKLFETERMERVLFGGCAATRIVGNYYL